MWLLQVKRGDAVPPFQSTRVQPTAVFSDLRAPWTIVFYVVFYWLLFFFSFGHCVVLHVLRFLWPLCCVACPSFPLTIVLHVLRFLWYLHIFFFSSQFSHRWHEQILPILFRELFRFPIIWLWAYLIKVIFLWHCRIFIWKASFSVSGFW